jgi:hypothetical protein
VKVIAVVFFFSKEKKLKKNTFLVFFTHFRLKVKE